VIASADEQVIRLREMKRTAIAVTAVILVFAAGIVVVLRPREMDVQLRFSNWQADGAAAFLLINRTDQAIDFGALGTQSMQTNGVPAQFIPGKTYSIIVNPHTNTIIAVKPYPAASWRAFVVYNRRLTIRDRVHASLRRSRLTADGPHLGTWVYSDYSTNLPPRK
jgi:hypothetical protein